MKSLRTLRAVVVAGVWAIPLAAADMVPGSAPALQSGGSEATVTVEHTDSGVIGQLTPDGSARGRLDGADGAVTYHTYYVDLLPEQGRLAIELDADIDLDLAVKHGAEIQNYAEKDQGGDWDCRDIDAGNPTTLVIDDPQPGRWYIDVFNALGGGQGAYRLDLTAEGMARREQSPPAATAEVPGTVRLVPVEVPDPALNGMTALSLLVPEGWALEGGVFWRMDQFPLSVLDLVLYDPQDGAAVRFLPPAHYSWQEGGIPGVDPGRLVYGGYLFLPPPIGAPQDFVQQIVIPQHFAQVQNLSVAGIESLPAVAAEAARANSAPGLQAQGESYRVRLQYEANGQPFEEDVYLTLLFFALGGGAWYWQPSELYSLRAPRGELDARTPLLRAVAASSSVSHDWFAINTDIHQRQAESILNRMRQLGDLHWQLYQERQGLTDMYHDAWQARQASQGRIHDAYSQHVRGLQAYETPGGERLDLPAGYDHAFLEQRSGTVLLTNETPDARVLREGDFTELPVYGR